MRIPQPIRRFFARPPEPEPCHVCEHGWIKPDPVGRPDYFRQCPHCGGNGWEPL